MNYLIIGRNSTIVQKIAPKLKNYDFISHKDIHATDLKKYRKIIIFSYSKNSLEENLALINSIKSSNIIYVSTSAIFSTQSRNQWNNYPNWKKLIEAKILDASGSIIRIGIWDKSFKDNIYGHYPFTSEKQLIETLNRVEKLEKIENCFKIEEGRLGKFKSFFARSINYLSKIAPNHILFRAPLEMIIKILNIKSYGYTHESNSFFCKKIMIGAGCLGSEFQKINKVNKILVSDKKDIHLTKNGFRDSIIGLQKNGLAKYWHGVSTGYDKDNNITKKVPFFIDRAEKVRKTEKFHALKIENRNDYFEIFGLNDRNIEISFFCNELVLAAGPLSNSILLKNFLDKDVFFDDHETINIGTITSQEAIKKNYLSKFGIIILNKKLEKLVVGDHEMLVEVRPYNSSKLKNNIYADTTKNIILKLFKKFDFETINEAFFNKFGFAIYTKKAFISLQILVKKAVRFDGISFSRVRISDQDLKNISDALKLKFDSFKEGNSQSFDGQHIMGGDEFYRNKSFLKLIETGRLKILGSPTLEKLDIFHNTEILKKKIRNEMN